MNRLVWALFLAACDPQPAPVVASPPPVASAASVSVAAAPPPVLDPAVREEVAVGDERWRLVWREAPKPICHDWTSPSVGAMCSCFNYDFAEEGRVDLVRTKDGAVVDKLDVSALVGETSDYYLRLPHWRRAKDDVREKVSLEEAKRGEVITLMRPLDYDHDGHATEFALRINRGGGPCGHYDEVVVVGTSTHAPKLHAFYDVLGTTIALRSFDDWQKLSRAKSGEKIRVDDRPCGDHGSMQQEWRNVWWDAEGIHLESKIANCE
jgi:hypothetical protein